MRTGLKIYKHMSKSAWIAVLASLVVSIVGIVVSNIVGRNWPMFIAMALLIVIGFIIKDVREHEDD